MASPATRGSGAASAADLLSSLVDEVITGYFAVIESIGRDIDRLDTVALKGADEDELLEAIVDVRRRIASMRRLVAPHRDALAALARPELQTEGALGQPWPGLVDRLERVLDGIDGLRDALLGTFDLHMARAAQSTNDVMKALTLLSAVLLPAALVAGIMGMNFELGDVRRTEQLLVRACSRWSSWRSPSSGSLACAAGSEVDATTRSRSW